MATPPPGGGEKPTVVPPTPDTSVLPTAAGSAAPFFVTTPVDKQQSKSITPQSLMADTSVLPTAAGSAAPFFVTTPVGQSPVDTQSKRITPQSLMEVSGLAKASDGITPAVGSTLEQQRGVAPASAHYACRVAQETATEFQQIEKVLDGLEQSGSLEVGMIFELGIGRQPFVIAAIMEMPSNTGRVFRLAEAGSGRVITMMRDASNTSRTLPGSVGKAPLVQDAAAAAGSSQPSGSLLGTIEYWASGLIPRDEDVKKRAKVAAELAPTSQQSIKASIKHIRSGGWAEDLAAEMPAHACGAEFTTSYAPSVMNRLAELYCVLLEEHDQNERKALAGVLEKLFSALSKVPFIKNDQIVFSRLSNLGNTSALDLASPLDQTVWSRGSSVIEVVEILVGARQFRSSRA